MFARCGTVSSPGALAVSSPERVRRVHRLLLKAASKSFDRAGSRDQAIRMSGVVMRVSIGPGSSEASSRRRTCGMNPGSSSTMLAAARCLADHQLNALRQ